MRVLVLRVALVLGLSVLLLAGCGSGRRHGVGSGAGGRVVVSHRATRTVAVDRPRPSVRPEALVAAESENRLVLVDLRRGRVLRSVPLPADPEYFAADRRVVVAVSARAGAVTLLRRGSLHRIRELTGFGSPHIPVISPSGEYAYVTDDARGTLTTIRLSDARVTSTVFVGDGAHHMGISPDGRSLWVALGQSASRIVLLDSSDPARPRITGAFDPGYLVHAVVFTPDGRRVWISSASGPDVGVFTAAHHQLLFRVPGGAAPQHIAFAGSSAYVTSGYSSTIERVRAATGRVIKRVGTPYGSFELDAAGGFVVTSSLFGGQLSIFDDDLDLRRTLRIAPATEDVVISPR